jgi:hypothetical protein
MKTRKTKKLANPERAQVKSKTARERRSMPAHPFSRENKSGRAAAHTQSRRGDPIARTRVLRIWEVRDHPDVAAGIGGAEASLRATAEEAVFVLEKLHKIARRTENPAFQIRSS